MRLRFAAMVFEFSASCDNWIESASKKVFVSANLFHAHATVPIYGISHPKIMLSRGHSSASRSLALDSPDRPHTHLLAFFPASNSSSTAKRSHTVLIATRRSLAQVSARGCNAPLHPTALPLSIDFWRRGCDKKRLVAMIRAAAGGGIGNRPSICFRDAMNQNWISRGLCRSTIAHYCPPREIECTVHYRSMSLKVSNDRAHALAVYRTKMMRFSHSVLSANAPQKGWEFRRCRKRQTKTHTHLVWSLF